MLQPHREALPCAFAPLSVSPSLACPSTLLPCTECPQACEAEVPALGKFWERFHLNRGPQLSPEVSGSTRRQLCSWQVSAENFRLKNPQRSSVQVTIYPPKTKAQRGQEAGAQGHMGGSGEVSSLFTPLLTPVDSLLSISHDLWGKIAGEPLPRAFLAPRFSLVGESSPETLSVLPHEGRDCIVFTV